MNKNLQAWIIGCIAFSGWQSTVFAQEKNTDPATPTPELDGAAPERSYLPGERPSEHKALIDEFKKQPARATEPTKSESEESPPVPTATDPEVTPVEPTKAEDSVNAANADDVKKEEPTPSDPAAIVGDPSHRFAVGFNLAWTTRQDYGARTFRRLTPEIIGFTYGALPWEEMWWRLGARVGYTSDQPEMPQAVRFEETDTTTLLEAAITRDWYVVPTLAFGGGYDFRRTKVKVSAPIDTADDRLGRKETLWMWYMQGGIGLPLLKARILLEPTVRYHTIQYDARSHWLFGVDMTVGI